jgi:hypothetical protein
MDAASIRQSIKDRLEELRPVLAEVEALERAEAVLAEFAPAEDPTPDMEALTAESEAHYAPWGYKADGVTPYKRKPPTPDEVARRVATRKANSARRAIEETIAAEAAGSRQELRLNVTSSLHPTEQELRDRRVAHVTAEPA